MIQASTARRLTGDWAGACSAARIDLDVDLRALRHGYGVELSTAVRDDLRHLAPDLLRWHMPRAMPDGLLRPGLTVSLARYRTDELTAHLVIRTPPSWASGPQRMVLSWWDGGAGGHPHPHPDRRFRLDLHRHLWDARRSAELPDRAGGPGGTARADWVSCRWAAEAQILRTAEDAPSSDVVVRLGSRRLLLRPDGTVTEPAPAARAARPGTRPLLLLPDAATWVPPDVLLLEAGMLRPAQLHPLVARALVAGDPGHEVVHPASPGTRLVDCGGSVHRLEVVDGVLRAVDHDAAEVRREQLLATLTGTPIPCLEVLDRLHRAPTELDDIRARLDHGDAASAVATVENLLGADAVLRAGDLRAELAAAASARVAYGAYRAGLPVRLLDPDAQRVTARVGDSDVARHGTPHRTPRQRQRALAWAWRRA
ncbi:hypothetical protein [Myceligenerans indicum]|uniref:Uncharacterized protein n=1 Tax=Myceligenerans indicum TaxID=2593663 RepID=A0ABS1LJ68_9MICO|nr:hypothetical protein [Myceligenerans indicum]MBL0886252.1 hypothetical protein [Myceligenerans indicum]